MASKENFEKLDRIFASYRKLEGDFLRVRWTERKREVGEGERMGRGKRRSSGEKLWGGTRNSTIVEPFGITMQKRIGIIGARVSDREQEDVSTARVT